MMLAWPLIGSLSLDSSERITDAEVMNDGCRNPCANPVYRYRSGFAEQTVLDE
jgi:hypothetical protein